MPSRYEFSTQQVINMSYSQLKSLSDKQLRTATRQLLDVATKRYKRAEQKWGDIGAVGVWGERTRGTGQVSLKGKSEAEIIKEALKAQQFLQSKTSTEKGRSEVKKKFEKTIGQKLTVNQYKQLWSIYNKVEEMSQAGAIEGYYAINYKTVIKDITSEIKSGNADQYLSHAQTRINQMYEDYQNQSGGEALTGEDLETFSGMDFEDLLF